MKQSFKDTLDLEAQRQRLEEKEEAFTSEPVERLVKRDTASSAEYETKSSKQDKQIVASKKAEPTYYNGIQIT